MIHRPPGRWPFNLIFSLLLLSMGALGLYLGSMIRRGRADEILRAERSRQLVWPLPARPGSIFARTRRRYILMAGSRRVACCFVDPKVLGEGRLDSAAIGVGQALGLDPVKLQDVFVSRRRDRYVGTVFVHGEWWTATSDAPVEAGQPCQVENRQGLTLIVKPSETGISES